MTGSKTRMATLFQETDNIDYKLWEIETIPKNQQIYIEQCHEIHKLLKELNTQDTTWEYYRYNIFSLSSSSQAFWFLWKNIQICVRDFIGTDQPAWMSGWLNFHSAENVLDWHNHKGSQYHGYVSIDPKNTKTIFATGDDSGYEVENKPGLLYLGPCERYHKVINNEDFEGTRITIAFDVTTEADVFSAKEKEYNWIPVY